ncbi:acyl-CoA dehydrogenase [Stutzerimonas xanthomarina]|jgi:alkylation response protein AidB-like acyl-CoA dehydrogenase|uniref:Acyl-CoA dehydrogenase n=1 Tax=Stutzerimonas xanthomarina TaxID=271420 RepID=A0A3R8U7U2_9GAMM|nr:MULTISPECIES: acyl-CoA dehydrogenase family protein [Stutzerimonas]MCW8158381.1 acyl-CoA dehydrogenase [Stutzerimonas stutzeri]RRV13462.1 acyl-CoA dehydrogenase [Stutzerimonas xanthomarina]
MNFTLTDEQKMLADSAERYIRERYHFEPRRAIAKGETGFSREHWASFAEMGWLALTIPEEDGGLGGSAFDQALLMEYLGGGLVVEPVVDTAVLCGTLIRHSGNAALRENLLGRIAAGEAVLALAHEEQHSRHEYAADVTATAKKLANGWSLSGVKHRVFHGGSADQWLVTAIPEGEKQAAVFVIDRNAAGTRYTTYELLDGSRGADITLTDVIVAEDALLLTAQQSGVALEEAFDQAVLALSSACLGSMEAVMAMTADYLKTRVQYGKPLAQFQALQHRMSEMFVETDQARSMLSSALAAIESGDLQRRRFAISGLKVVAARAHYFVTAQGIQLHGGIGTTDEYAVGHHYKFALMYDKRFGDSDFHLDRANADLTNVEQPLKGGLYA